MIYLGWEEPLFYVGQLASILSLVARRIHILEQFRLVIGLIVDTDLLLCDIIYKI